MLTSHFMIIRQRKHQQLRQIDPLGPENSGQTHMFISSGLVTAFSIVLGAWATLLAPNVAHAAADAPIIGSAYHDQNANSTRDGNEPGVPDITVTAFNANNVSVGVAQTDIQGNFTLTLTSTEGMPVSPVRVEFTEIKPEFSVALATSVVRFVDNPSIPLQLALNRTIDFCPTLIPEGECLSAPVRATGRIWHDKNANGVQDASELALAGITVRLYDQNGTLISTQLTNVSGRYDFSSATLGNYGADGVPNTPDDSTLAGLKPSTNGLIHTYTLVLDNASDFAGGGPLDRFSLTQSHTASSDHSDIRDSDGVIGSPGGNFPQMTFVAGSPGTANATLDLGLFPAAAVGGLAWLDSNSDGVRGVDEIMLPNVPIELYDEAFKLLATSSSRGNGIYRFSGLLAGRYQVRFIAPWGYTFTVPLSGTDRSINSDATFPLGFAAPFLLNPSDAITGIDVGLVQLSASLSMKVRANGATTQETGPSLMSNSLISWTYEISNTGLVTLTNIAVSDDGSALVKCPASGLAAGAQMTCTSQSVAVPGIYTSRVRVNGTNGALLVGNTTVAYSTSADYYGIAPVSINGRVWFDVNRNAIRDSDEAQVPNVLVSLYQRSDNTTPILTSTVSNDGLYTFGSLLPGTYRVKVSLAAEHGLAVTGASTDDSVNNDFDPASAQTADFTLNESQILNNIDAGVWANGPSLALALYANQQDGGTWPGVLVLSNKPLAYSYVVLNLGNAPVTEIVVSDTNGLVNCPKTVGLQPGQKLVCQTTVTEAGALGQNQATVRAQSVFNNVTRTLMASDQVYYQTGSPRLSLRQSAVPTHNTPVANGTLITYTIMISNTGTFTAFNITLENFVPVGTGLVLASVVPSATNAASVFNSGGQLPLRWLLPALGPGQATTVQFAAKVSMGLSGSITAIIQELIKVQSPDMSRLTLGNPIVHPFLPTVIDVEQSASSAAPAPSIMPTVESGPNSLPAKSVTAGGVTLTNTTLPVAVATSAKVDVPGMNTVITPVLAPNATQPVANPVIAPTAKPTEVVPLAAVDIVSTPMPVLPTRVTISSTNAATTRPAADPPLAPQPVVTAPPQSPALRVLPSVTPSAHVSPMSVVQAQPAATRVNAPLVLVHTNPSMFTGLGLLMVLGVATLCFGVMLAGLVWWVKH